MANQIIGNPSRVLDLNGYPVPGAKMTVYQSGTATLLSVYSDIAGTILAANPVIADANGVLPQRYVTASAAKVVITDAADVPLYTLDPAPMVQATGSGASQISFAPSVNVPATNVQEAIDVVAEKIVFGAGPLFDSTAALLADTVLTYTPDVNLTVEAGDIVQTRSEGFSYQVAASGASDHDLTTAGGVKLYVLSVDVTAFGAVGDGVADDTAEIQAAINSGARRITAPAGKTFKTTATLTINASNIELDFNHSTVELSDATGLLDHLVLGDGITQRTGLRIRNITFTRAQAATAGYAINSNLIGVTEISGCRIFGNNRIHGGIRIYRGIIVNIFKNYIDNYVNFGIYLEGSGLVANRTVDVSIRENRVEGGVTALKTWDFVEGLFCRDNIFFNTSGSGVSVDASTNANGLFSFKLQENDFDTCSGVGLYMDKVNNVQITGCWFANVTLDTLQLKSDLGSAIVADNQFYPTAAGIRIEGTDVRVNGNLISGGTTSVNVAGGTRIGISGNNLQNSNVGVDLNSAADVHVHGNFFSGIASAALQNLGTTARVQDNFGDTAVGTSGFITVGASPFTYTAGARPECVSVFAGTVSAISINGNNLALTTNNQITLAPRQSVTVTYSSAPFMLSNIL